MSPMPYTGVNQERVVALVHPRAQAAHRSVNLRGARVDAVVSHSLQHRRAAHDLALAPITYSNTRARFGREGEWMVHA